MVSTRLSAAEQFEAATEAARRGLGGGKVYDLLTLKCAMKASAERGYALNLTEFTRLAPPELKGEVGDGFLADSSGRKLPLYACY